MCSYPASQLSLMDVESFDGIAVFAADGKYNVTEWGSGCQVLTGFTADQKIGLHLSGLFADLNVSDLPERESKTMFADLIVANGRTVPVMLKLTFSESAPGSYSVMIISVQDSEYTELKYEVQETSQKLADMENFHRQVVHDLRAPLRAIIGYGRIIHEEFADKCDPEGLRMLNAILINSVKAQRYIEDLRKVMQVISAELHPEPCDLTQMLSSIIEDKAVKNPSITVHSVVNEMPEVYADKELIHEAIWQIVSNSFKYRDDSDVLTLDVEAKSEGGDLLVIIRDNGIGFDQRFAKEVFQIYRKLQTDEDNDSGGIGLTLAKKIIDKHKGKIWIESAVGQGTNVFVKLPKVMT